MCGFEQNIVQKLLCLSLLLLPPPPPTPHLHFTVVVKSVNKVNIPAHFQVPTCQKCLLMRCPSTSLTMTLTTQRQQP